MLGENVKFKVVYWNRFILLKERDLLLTMVEEYSYQYELFSNFERIEKLFDYYIGRNVEIGL